MADVKTLMKKVKLIELKTHNFVDTIFAGSFQSKLKGHGMDFAEIRNYIEGDDIRNIDWNVSAKYRTLFVKEYEEEKDLNVILAVDVSKSMNFGSFYSLKNELVAELVATFALSAKKYNNKVGLLLFSDKIERYIPPSSSDKHVMLLIREVLEEFKGEKEDIYVPIKFLSNVLNRRSIIIFISDFLFKFENENLKKLFKILAKKHDLYILHVYDVLEKELPNSSLVRFRDIENGEYIYINTKNKKVRENYKREFEAHCEQLKNFFVKNGMKYEQISTGEEYTKKLLALFR